MRPGRKRPGYKVVNGLQGTGSVASMRPGRKRPGYLASFAGGISGKRLLQ